MTARELSFNDLNKLDEKFFGKGDEDLKKVIAEIASKRK